MALSKKRQAELKKRWKKSKAPAGGRRRKIPVGTYQANIDKVTQDTSKPGKWAITWHLSILSNKKLKGVVITKRNDLLWEPKPRKKGDSDGLDFFKSDLETIGYDMPELTEKSMKKLLKAVQGTTLEIYIQDSKGDSSYQNTYFNSAINDDDEEEDEEEVEDDEEDEEEEEEEDEEDDEDEDEDDDEDDNDDEEDDDPPPKKKKKSKKKAKSKPKKSKKKSKKEVDEDDDGDVFDEDDDDDEEWED